MKYPHPRQFKAFFRSLPPWVPWLIAVLLVARLLVLLAFHLFSG